MYAFIVKAGNHIIQIFDNNLTNILYGVAHNQRGYILFDLGNEYIGHLETDSRSGFNQFDLNNEWIAFVK